MFGSEFEPFGFPAMFDPDALWSVDELAAGREWGFGRGASGNAILGGAGGILN